jgi:L-ascorbate metabolism protein UlaG (beta-lactamase superfamily)
LSDYRGPAERVLPNGKEKAVLERFTWFRQSAMRFRGGGLTVYIDPWGTAPDDEPADVIFITHAHFDHFQPKEIERLRRSGTKLVAPHDVAKELSGDVKPVAPGDSDEVGGVRFTAVPAYNVVEHRLKAHPKANRWVGYVMELGGATYYHSGDTDHAPELDAVKADVAMVCIGGDPYTMGPAEAAGLVKVIGPKVAVPMHFGFVVGERGFADAFRKEAAPVPVEVLDPVAGWGAPSK